MKTTINIDYYGHGGASILTDSNIGFTPFIGQIIENVFLKNNSCTGIFYICDISTYKDTKNSYVIEAKAWERDITDCDHDIKKCVEEYYSNPR